MEPTATCNGVCVCVCVFWQHPTQPSSSSIHGGGFCCKPNHLASRIRGLGPNPSHCKAIDTTCQNPPPASAEGVGLVVLARTRLLL